MRFKDKKSGKDFVKSETLVSKDRMDYTMFMYVMAQNVTDWVIAQIMSIPDEDAEAVVNRISEELPKQFANMTKMLSNDYHVLVNDGKMPETEFCAEEEAGFEKTMNAIRESMEEAKAELIMDGAPVTENSSGKIEIDTEKMIEEYNSTKDTDEEEE